MSLKLVDNNGKTFEVELSEITDFQTVSGVTVADSEPVTNIISITDADGNPLNIDTLMDSIKEDEKNIPKALDVTFEATHSGPNRNKVIYHSDSMQEDAVSWMTPFAKPLIKNHDMDQEPLGRVVHHDFRQSALNPDRDTIAVTWRVTDQDAIVKFLDGRYKTMSIGGSVKHLSCNVCGKDILKDGKFKFCGHWKGERYNDNECLWNAKKIEYKEGSIVNAPADDWAQAVNIKVAPTDSKDSEPQGGQKDMSKPAELDILDQIDNLTSQDEKPEDAPQTDGDVNADTPADTPVADADTDPEATPDVADSTEDIEAVKAERDDLKAQLDTLTGEKTQLEDTVKELQAEVSTLSKDKEVLQEELKLSDEDCKAARKQSIQLAVMNKDLLANRVADRKQFTGEVTAEYRDSLIGELKAKSAKELTTMIGDMDSKPMVRKPVAQVTSPAEANLNDAHSITVDSETDEVVAPKEQLTLKDLEDAVVNTFTRSNYAIPKEEY